MLILLLILASSVGTACILLFITLALNQQGGFKFFWNVDHIQNIQRYIIYFFFTGIVLLILSIYLLLYIISTFP
ncbi:hypothetical protein [Staphylococcus ratti]|uniref:Uncharacterized protein n=1 Tax=Staphylococcus ratti TaxID=2892440 RepID=A0ABY3PAV5_9STAP|nr:hypothetical protein [Staphylococcus ratti]UEX89414.1 hypothetical protein LN051_07445 [Staphylococcus ratti]